MNNDLNDNNIENKLNDSKELLISLKDELKSAFYSIFSF